MTFQSIMFILFFLSNGLEGMCDLVIEAYTDEPDI